MSIHSLPVRVSRARRTVSVLAALSIALAGLLVVPTAAAAPGHGTIVNPVPSANTPAINNGRVFGIAQVGNTVVVGGTFSSVTPAGGSAQTRNYLFAFNATSGALINAFAPNLNGAVNDVIPGPTAGTVYVGGAFNQVNGGNASHLTLLDVSTGTVVGGFRAAATNGVVNALVLRGGRLLVGGNFTTAGGVAHRGLASVHATTGALDGYLGNQVTERHNDSGSGAQGAIGVREMDLSADGTRLVAIGNFKKVDGLERDQVVMLSLGQSSSEVTSDWRTEGYQPYCFNWAFDTYVRGVSFSPDGSYFVVTATGGHNAGTLCDAAARFETHASGSNIQPTWVDYSGGDTLWAVAVTEKAVYVGGHQRWMNNSLASDAAGPGAVPRPGLAALDVNTGVPLKWNAARNPRGAAVFAFHATDQGLWMGSDTEYVGARYAYRRPRIAFFPLSGGKAQAPDATPAIPGTAYLAARTGQNGNILYRVNAAGPTLGAVDAGPDWVGDESATSPYRNSGTNVATYSPGASTDETVPSTTPNAVFDSERWSPSDNPAMEWEFGVTAGVPIEVRLFFANRCSCTSGEGSRVFDVMIDGDTVLNDFDIVADAGDQRGTMRSFQLTSDGRVDIDFRHAVENPLINAIEIVRTDQPPPTGNNDVVTAIPVNAGGAESGTEVDSDGIDFGAMRGTFVAGGKLYYGRNDSFYFRDVDGTSFGSETKIDPYHDPDWSDVDTGSGNTYDGRASGYYGEISAITGAAYADGRVYYHLNGRATLYWRWFNTDSGIVGADRFEVAGSVDFSDAMGMFISGHTLYYVSGSDGNLNAIGLTDATTTGSPTVVDSPADGGNNWRSRTLFLTGANAPANEAPKASFTVECVELNCTFDASASTDADGSIDQYAWNFGDGSTATGQSAAHAYADGGSYDVKLVVTDNLGATATVTKTAQPGDPEPPAEAIEFVGSTSNAANSATPTVSLPTEIQAGDLLLMTAALNSVRDATPPSGWTRLDQVTTIGTTSYVWTRRATAGDAGASRTVSLDGSTKSVLTVVAYRGVSVDDPISGHATGTDSGSASHTSPVLVAPTGDTIVTVWTDKAPNTAEWTPPSAVTARIEEHSGGSGRVSTLVADSPAPADGQAGGLTATTDVISTRATSWTIALNPA